MRVSLIFFLLIISQLTVCAQASTALSLGKKISPFCLKNVDGKQYCLEPSQKGYVLVFMCNHCPMAKKYFEKLNVLQQEVAASNFELVAINPMDSVVYEEETLEQMNALHQARHLQYPYLQDAEQTVAKQLQVSHTPLAYVLQKDGDSWKVQYQGAIDDGDEKHPKNWVLQAVSDLAHHKKVATAHTTGVGCQVYYRKVKK